jgi:predicted GIY-YIG superfamily endonuclease
MTGQLGTIYLVHLDRRYGHAAHYTGWTTDLDARLEAHRQGRGSRLLAVVREAGIGWTLARTWTGDRARERQLKNEGGASRRCPECGVTPRRGKERGMDGNDERDHQEERANDQLMRDGHEPDAPGNHGMCSDLAPCRTVDPAGTLSGYSPQEQCEAEQDEAGNAMASSIYPYAPYPTAAEIRADNLARGFGSEAAEQPAKQYSTYADLCQETPAEAERAARALAEHLGPDEQGFGPITDYVWSVDPPARESGMEAGQ